MMLRVSLINHWTISTIFWNWYGTAVKIRFKLKKNCQCGKKYRWMYIKNMHSIKLRTIPSLKSVTVNWILIKHIFFYFCYFSSTWSCEGGMAQVGGKRKIRFFKTKLFKCYLLRSFRWIWWLSYNWIFFSLYTEY